MRYLYLACFLIVFGQVELTAQERQPVEFNREIRPMLAAKCFACHGPDESHRDADLRLDERKVAIDFGAIVPGEPDESELIRRITSEDPDERMPPPETGEPLTSQQQRLFRTWIQEGAVYEKHWAFSPPKKHPLPPISDTSWPRNAIDNFVLSPLETAGMKPSSEADPYTLVRRVHLDLIGLPPTPEEADAFVADDDPHAYENLVDRLLHSERYGERWAQPWLDLARYADSNGYEKDRGRSIWPYRDWVIRALNADMPFDQFTVEQLAGDMLPGATIDQLLATGFHRNTMLNEEGGIDPLEFRHYAMVDRVATTGTVWLGLSVGCAQCHTHKYDPITHTDYYRLMALLNNADEPEILVKQPEIQSKRDQIEQQIAELEGGLVKRFPPAAGERPIETRSQENFETAYTQWLTDARTKVHKWETMTPFSWETNLPRLELLEDGSVFSSGDITKRDVFRLRFDVDASMLPVSAVRLEVLPDERLPGGGPGRTYYEGRKGHFFLSEFAATLNDEPLALNAPPSEGNGGAAASNATNVIDGNGSTGWGADDLVGRPQQLVLNLDTPISQLGELQIELLFESHFAASLGRFRFSAVSANELVVPSGFPPGIENLVTRFDELDEKGHERLRQYFLSVTPKLAEARMPIDELRQKMPTFPTTLVMQERPDDNPRQTFRHHRGEYLSPKEAVDPGAPVFLSSDGSNNPSNRLELAQWLVSDANPLIGRVTVNRVWQAVFGVGLHQTSDDFGTQSPPPTHPKLLDWLACEFVEQGWSLKELLRLIVTSATYRQSAVTTAEQLQSDPENNRLARGPRFRVEAEMVRDIMLRASGLLSTEMYGPGVRPPQPASVTAVAYGSPKWNASVGADRFRRSIYTWKKRTAPFAAYSVFDAPSGENCVARRNRSNTPLQALTLLNDQMYMELARGLAKVALSNSDVEEETIRYIFRRLLVRPPESEELVAIEQYHKRQLERLQLGELAASDILGEESATNQQAAWAMVARALMNLDEVITKP